MPELPGDVMQGWIQNPKGLKKFLKGLCPPETASSRSSFPVWKTITLGIYKSANEYREMLKANGFKIGNWGDDILGKPAFTASPEETEVELVKMTVAELGFRNGATRKEIYERALELELKLCPNEVGPALRLQYTDQPMSEWILVAMEPIADSDGYLDVFASERSSDGLWLHGLDGSPDNRCSAGSQWVFSRGK
ncbi:MAG: hypothetical protein WC587_03475 [Candidatus Paceibacterota bacterium]